MPPTPEDPSAPEQGKLELPSLGGLLRRRRKSATPADPEGADGTTVPEPPAPAPEASGPEETSPEQTPPEETRPLQVVELGSEADEPDPEVLVADPVSDEPEPDQPGPDSTRGPDLVAPATAYAESERQEAPGQDEPEARRRRPSLPAMPALPRPSLPLLPDQVAAPLTGVIVGLVGVLLIYLFQGGCELVRGAGSCGGAGVALLVVVLVLMVFAGAALLRAWFVEEALTTSFLAVALVAVVSMLLLLPVIDRWFMVIVIPVLAGAFYWLSWWVTSRFDAPEREAQRERENAR